MCNIQSKILWNDGGEKTDQESSEPGELCNKVQSYLMGGEDKF